MCCSVTHWSPYWRCSELHEPCESCSETTAELTAGWAVCRGMRSPGVLFSCSSNSLSSSSLPSTSTHPQHLASVEELHTTGAPLACCCSSSSWVAISRTCHKSVTPLQRDQRMRAPPLCPQAHHPVAARRSTAVWVVSGGEEACLGSGPQSLVRSSSWAY